jgi:hypothetical protein
MDRLDGRDIYLRAIKEALDFLQTSFSQGSTTLINGVSFADLSYTHLKGHWGEFLALVSCVNHIQIAVHLEDWSL